MKIGLLLAATIAVGMFALPGTMAYFTGQHNFVDPVSVDCGKCHGDIQTELSGSGGNVHEFLDCQACHVTTAMSAMGDNPADKAGHASVAVECMDCHNAATGAFPQAGPLGDHDITASTAAHNAWYLNALNSDVNYGANEVCIACHTMSNIDITWTASDGKYTFDQGSGEFGEEAN